jgi:predicted secreted protein
LAVLAFTFRDNTMPSFVRSLSTLTFTFAFALGAAASFAQTAPPPEPRNIVALSANATLEVQQDWLTLTLTTIKEGTEPATVQSQVRQALEAALSEAKKLAQAGAMELHTGAFSLQPRYGRDGKIAAWIGSAELVLEGRDFARIGTTAGKVQTMAVGNSYFSLSREARAKVDAEVQALAIDKFKSRASDIAKGFGFGGYTLREVTVSSDDQGGNFARARPMAMSAKAMVADAPPVPLESGKSNVLISVNGSVQLK